MRAAIRVLLMAFPGQVPHFLLHHQVDQGQSRLAQQVTDSFLQKAHHLGHGKDHLDVGVLFAGELAELLYRSLLLNLVSSLHSDSLLFPGGKFPRLIMAEGLRVATFYELTDILSICAAREDLQPVCGFLSIPQPQGA
jgi:hypothetical protein